MTINPAPRRAGILNRIRDYFTAPNPTPTEEGMEKLRRLGADIPARLEDAALLEASGASSDLVALIARAASMAKLDADAFVLLPERGISTAEITEWIARAVNAKASHERNAVHEEVLAAAVEEASRSSVAWGALSAVDRTAPIEAATHLREVATVAANAALRALDEAVSGR